MNVRMCCDTRVAQPDSDPTRSGFAKIKTNAKEVATRIGMIQASHWNARVDLGAVVWLTVDPKRWSPITGESIVIQIPSSTSGTRPEQAIASATNTITDDRIAMPEPSQASLAATQTIKTLSAMGTVLRWVRFVAF